MMKILLPIKKLEFQKTFLNVLKFNQLATLNGRLVLWYSIFMTSTKKSVIRKQVQQHQNIIWYYFHCQLLIIVEIFSELYKIDERYFSKHGI